MNKREIMTAIVAGFCANPNVEIGFDMSNPSLIANAIIDETPECNEPNVIHIANECFGHKMGDLNTKHDINLSILQTADFLVG